jgi:hypothetical protein
MPLSSLTPIGPVPYLPHGSPVQQVRLPIADDPRSASTASNIAVKPPSSHLTVDPLPPHYQVCCHCPHGARAASPPHLVCRRARAGSANVVALRAVIARASVSSAPRRSGQLGRCAAGPSRRPEAGPQCGPALCARILNFFFYNSRNLYIFQKICEKYNTTQKI